MYIENVIILSYYRKYNIRGVFVQYCILYQYLYRITKYIVILILNTKLFKLLLLKIIP